MKATVENPRHPAWVDPKTAAEIARVSRDTIWRWAREDRIKSYRGARKTGLLIDTVSLLRAIGIEPEVQE